MLHSRHGVAIEFEGPATVLSRREKRERHAGEQRWYKVHAPPKFVTDTTTTAGRLRNATDAGVRTVGCKGWKTMQCQARKEVGGCSQHIVGANCPDKRDGIFEMARPHVYSRRWHLISHLSAFLPRVPVHFCCTTVGWLFNMISKIERRRQQQHQKLDRPRRALDWVGHAASTRRQRFVEETSCKESEW